MIPPEKESPVLPGSTSMRVLEVDLETGVGRMGRFESEWPELDLVAGWSGSALAWALQADAARAGRDAPFVLAVGDAVRGGIPTAARVCICGRGAHTGKIAEGSVGGSLGRRLATVADALVLRGRAPEGGRVLVVDAMGGVSWRDGEGEAGLSEWLGSLAAAHPDAARLSVGLAALRGVSFANLCVGEDPPSFVGRGGLGATLAGMGLRSIVVEAPMVVPSADARAWVERLQESPRLRERAAGGSLERAYEASLRGDDALERGAARSLAEAGVQAGVGVRGCAGCPTPCGWVFETPAGARLGGRFNALDSLGGALGLDESADALRILAACNEVGVDAKEVGAALAVWARARAAGVSEDGPRFGEVEDFEEAIGDLGRGAGPGWVLSVGAQELAERFGVAAETARGEAARPRQGLGGELAAEVAARGVEPMRTFAFLLEGGVPRARAERLLSPLELSKRGLDPEDPSEKGRLVWWHENLVAGLDSTGFCAFSAAGALADGVMELEELAGELLGRPASRDAAMELLGRGASLCLLAREVSGTDGGGRPPSEKLSEPWEEYRALRGLDADGAVLPEVAALVGGPEVLRWERSGGVLPLAPPRPMERGAGEVSFSGSGEVGRALGGTVFVALEFPATLGVALEALTLEREVLRGLLFVRGTPITTGWRDEERVDLDDPLADGDHLDLVLAVGGG